MSKPREWWIRKTRFEPWEAYYTPPDADDSHEEIRVIDKSAYDRLTRAVKIFIEHYGVKESQSAESKELIKALEGE